MTFTHSRIACGRIQESRQAITVYIWTVIIVVYKTCSDDKYLFRTRTDGIFLEVILSLWHVCPEFSKVKQKQMIWFIFQQVSNLLCKTVLRSPNGVN